MQRITPILSLINLGAVNTYVVEDAPDDLTLIDTGFEGSAEKIFRAVRKGGRNPEHIRRIILTHTHPDHAGAVVEIRERVGAIPVYAHAADAALAEQGIAGRLPHVVSPGLVNKIVYRLFIKNSANAIPAFTTDVLLDDGDVLPFGGGLQVVHTPGHSLGHVALLMTGGDLLIAGDLCANMMGPGFSTVYEDREVGLQSIRKAASLAFTKAVFGHGKPLMKKAAERLRKVFGEA